MEKQKGGVADLFGGLGLPGEEDVAEAPRARTTREWSAYQLAVFRDVEEGRGHTVVSAVAGSGKSTTLVEAFHRVPRGCTSVMMAFNKKIADELREKAPPSVDVMTLHSYGLRAITRAFGRLPIEGKKVDSIARRLRGEEWSRRDERTALCKLVSLAKGSLAQTKEELLAIIEEYRLDAVSETEKDREAAANDALLILKECRDPNGSIDFDDMVWLPVVLALRPWQYDRVFIDETQDLNAAQIELALRASKPGSGRILACGDEFQSIYQFRGADSRSMPALVERLRAKTMPLSITYRCARRIVEEAKPYVPHLECSPTAEEGEVHSGNEANMVALAAPGDFILSRANAPLVSLCLRFLREGRRAAVQGRDVGASLEALIKKSRATSVEDLLGWVSVWKAKEMERLARKDEDTQPVEDRADTMSALCEEARSVQEVSSRIVALFSDEDDANRIVLSTTHKAKGLERDRVFLLRDTYLRKDTQEERNLFYVAVTRARKSLWYIRKTNPQARVEATAAIPAWADPARTPAKGLLAADPGVIAEREVGS